MLALSLAITSCCISIISLIVSITARKLALQTQQADIDSYVTSIEGNSASSHPTDRKQKESSSIRDASQAFEAVRVDLSEEEEYWREVEALRKRS